MEREKSYGEQVFVDIVAKAGERFRNCVHQVILTNSIAYGVDPKQTSVTTGNEIHVNQDVGFPSMSQKGKLPILSIERRYTVRKILGSHFRDEPRRTVNTSSRSLVPSSKESLNEL